MNKGKVELKTFNNDSDTKTFQYLVEHNNGKTTVEQLLTISSESNLFNDKWNATIKLDDFPCQETPQLAAEKLADWLERLSQAIRSGEYHYFKQEEFKDIKK